MACTGNGLCIRQCWCICFKYLHRQECKSTRKNELNFTDYGDVNSDEIDPECTCFEARKCYSRGLKRHCDSEWPIEIPKKRCRCGHREHSGYSPSECCSLVKCPKCQDPNPLCILQCHNSLCYPCNLKRFSSVRLVIMYSSLHLIDCFRIWREYNHSIKMEGSLPIK